MGTRHPHEDGEGVLDELDILILDTLLRRFSVSSVAGWPMAFGYLMCGSDVYG